MRESTIRVIDRLRIIQFNSSVIPGDSFRVLLLFAQTNSVCALSSVQKRPLKNSLALVFASSASLFPLGEMLFSVSPFSAEDAMLR